MDGAQLGFFTKPSTVAGLMFGVALTILLDAIIINEGEMPANRCTGTLLLHALFSTIGLALVMLSSLTHRRKMHAVTNAMLLVGWGVCFFTGVSALIICKSWFTGMQERMRAEPGVALVGFTSAFQLCGFFVWQSGQSLADEYTTRTTEA
ncbi:hypothetical protein TRVL_04689 [Trypanosoma vivax]|uniref:Uncharacterized protein n=1 Tax=Trypanosoma vivax (strain Y486) TaxID=1055687 RepID=G0TWF3_TRYVY|nr:hypothetical protein TRVL_04689 [Trypanosoma vivax]CCC48291.1 conserved hypothetical protein [Trypanosoma vivax Y486]